MYAGELLFAFRLASYDPGPGDSTVRLAAAAWSSDLSRPPRNVYAGAPPEERLWLRLYMGPGLVAVATESPCPLPMEYAGPRVDWHSALGMYLGPGEVDVDFICSSRFPIVNEFGSQRARSAVPGPERVL